MSPAWPGWWPPSTGTPYSSTVALACDTAGLTGAPVHTALHLPPHPRGVPEEGTVRADGIDLTYLRLPVEETFFRMARHQEFDVAEMSLSTYVMTMGDTAGVDP